MFSNINFGELTYIIMGMTLFIISGSVHEFGHAFSAYILGDDTAKFNGRLTANPLAHIDIIGTIVFPLVAIFSGLNILGWMRPVPVNPGNFKNPSKGYAITSFAGPFSNLMQASFGVILLKLIIMSNSMNFSGITGFDFIIFYIQLYIKINIILMVFNLLPIPPLDGGGIIRHFLPPNLQDKFDNIYRFGIIILYLILFSGLLGIIFTPFNQFLKYIFTNIQDIGFFVITTPFLTGIFLIYIFLKDDISSLIKRKNITTEHKNEEKNAEKNIIETKNENLTLTNKLQDILKKIKNKGELDKKDKDFLKEISDNSVDYSKLCEKIDFNIDEAHCNECEYFINCLLRDMKEK